MSGVGERRPESAGGAGPHLLDIDDLDRDEIVALLDRAEEFRRQRPRPPLPLQGQVVGLFFFQPSTRTRLGFHAAAARLGATAIELTTTKFEAGMSAPETPLDSFRSIAGYCDVIVLRHRDEDEFREMVRHSPVPVINGGCGTSSHPTQTLVDLFAIRSHFGRIEGLRIGLVGDLAGSRAAKSLVKALRHFPPAELRLMAPEGRSLPADSAEAWSPVVECHTSVRTKGLDVVYVAGFPENRETDPGPADLRDLRRSFSFGAKWSRDLGPSSMILNPLPRIDEISSDIDRLPQAGYFHQSQLALFVRMALMGPYNRFKSLQVLP